MRIATEAQQRKMVEAYKGGASLTAAAALCGYTSKACRNALAKADIERRDTRFGPARKPVCLNKTNQGIRSQMVADYLAGETLKQCAAKYGYSTKACLNALKEVGIERRKGRFPGAQERTIELYRRGKTIVEIAQTIGCSEALCRQHLKKNHIPVRKRDKAKVERSESSIHPLEEELLKLQPERGVGKGFSRKYVLNKSYFQFIETEEQAYWLGFIAADGCITQPGQMRLTLKASDRIHLELFRSHIGSNAPITLGMHSTGKEQARLDVNSMEFVNHLLALGILPRKSLTLTPWDGPVALMRHYWRGCIDGDGWFFQQAQKRTMGWSVGFCGNTHMVAALADYIECNLGFRPCVSTKRPTCHRFSLYSRKAQAFATCFYGNATVTLQRKQILARKLMRQTNFGPQRQ